MSYSTVILASWGLFMLVWAVGAFNVKRDIAGGAQWRYVAFRLVGVVLVVFAVTRILTGAARYTKAGAVLGTGLFTPPLALGWGGAALTVLGVLFAIWARVHLGRNWSSVPSAKEGHELVTSGPYRFVRHPIYTGVILATFGAALSGSVFGIGIFLIAAVVTSRRISIEERIMCDLFPDTYPAYQARTKKLIPFVW